ncbi:MAG: GNAT family N-acetyltransferase [Planctomycetota bacterium]
MPHQTNPAPLYRLLLAADLPAAQRLRELAHWNQTGADWLNLLALEPQGCFAAEVNGLVIGTATTTRFLPDSGPGSFAWVGMVLVDPGFRGQGTGSTLLRRALDYLRGCGVETIKLDATPPGRALYLKHGFQDECNLERWAGQACSLPAPACALAPLSGADLAAAAAYDALAFGANRHSILQAWFQSWPEAAVAAWEGQRLAGYALARRGANYCHAGPLVCDSPETGRALLARVLQTIAGQPVIIDLFSENAWVRELAAQAGLRRQRELVRMSNLQSVAQSSGLRREPEACATAGQRPRIAASAGPEVG